MLMSNKDIKEKVDYPVKMLQIVNNKTGLKVDAN